MVAFDQPDPGHRPAPEPLPALSQPALSRRGSFRLAGVGMLGALGAGRAGAAKGAGVQRPDSPPFSCIPRYKGYRADDLAQPYAGYFTGTTSPVPARVRTALSAGPVDPALGVPHSGLEAEMSRAGYSAVETGYTTLPGGQLWVACLTDMPGVRPEMWDWWFGWHSTQSARYKLWHPDAHTVASLKEDRSGDRTLSDRERYVGNTSYVDEYIGSHLEQLAIRFDDPVKAGFDAAALGSATGGTLVYGRVGSSVAPLDLGWLNHQVRPTATGCEMRSRFYLNDLGLGSIKASTAACGLVRGLAPLPSLPFGNDFGADLLEHCGAEMNHLASFLPRLYAQFKDTP